MNERNLDDTAVRTELVESVCDELAALKKVVPCILEEDLVLVAYRSARSLGWGEDESELQEIFRHVAACLMCPVPDEVAR